MMDALSGSSQRRLVEHVLGAKAVPFLRSSLEQGDAVAACFMEIDVASVEIVAPMPAGLSADASEAFESGGTGACQATRALQLQMLAAHVAQDERSCAVFETYGRRGDRGLADEQAALFFAGDRVYAFATSKNSLGEDQVRHALRYAREYPLVGVLTSLPPSLARLDRNAELSDAEVRGLASRATLLMIGAYDEEGMLLIRRPDGRPLLGGAV